MIAAHDINDDDFFLSVDDDSEHKLEMNQLTLEDPRLISLSYLLSSTSYLH